MGKRSTTILKAIQPDIDKWRESDINHVVIFDITPDSVTWSFCSSGDTPEGCDTISIVREGGYFRIKYNTNTKYIITKHGDIFINSYTVDSDVVSDSSIRKALKTSFSNPDSTDTIFRNEIFDTIRDWTQRHINGANVYADGIALSITKNGSILSTIDIRSAINNANACCVKINGSILAIWSGNEWIISNDQLTGCTGKLSINEVGCLRDVIVNIKPKEQKSDSTDEQLLESSNVKSFDKLWEMWEAANNKYTPDESFELWKSVAAKHTVPPLPSMGGSHALEFDMYKQITDDLKSLAKTMEQPIVTATQKPNRNRQMMHRIKPIVTKWLKDIVYSAGPFSSFEEVSDSVDSASLKYSFILHGDRDANISMEIPYGFIGTMFISHDGVKIMRIDPDDVVLLFPFNNIDPDIQINRLHLSLYDVLNIKQRRSKLDELIRCTTLFIRICYPDIQYSICGKHINIIKRSAAADAPVGSIKFGFSYKPGYQLAVWQDNNYDNPFIEIDDKWKPILLETQDKFAHKMYSWLSVNFGCEEENPCVIPDSLAKSLCSSDKVITPIRFTPMTHNFKSWASIGFAEAVNLKTIPEGAGLIMEIVKERNNMIKIPGIKNVLFNDTKHTTTVLFDDGTITMSKTTDGETYDHEVGFAMCIMKKMYGNRTRFQKEIKRWTSICENANKKIADKAAKKQEKNEEEVES